MANQPSQNRDERERELRRRIANCAIQIAESLEYERWGGMPNDNYDELGCLVNALKKLVLPDPDPAEGA